MIMTYVSFITHPDITSILVKVARGGGGGGGEYQRQSGKGFRSAFKENSNPSQQYLLSLSCFALFLLDFMFALLGLNTSDQPTHFQFTSKLNYVYNMYLQLVKQRLPVIL